MPLSWIKRAKRPASVDELVAAEKYGKAIDLMRRQFSQRYPSTTERQGYAELLVRAGRGAEAVPVLLGIADEQERYGFPDKALEALRCAAAIDPEQAEVKERLESVRSAPTGDAAVEPSTPTEAPGADESWGTALDGASAAPAEPTESVSVVEEAPAGGPEFTVLDAEDPDPEAHDGGQESHGDDVPGAAPPGNEPELVVLEEASETTPTSLHVSPGVVGAERTGSDDGEITARSLHVDPSVLGEEGPEPADGDVDHGEITARSLHVDPSVLGEEGPEPADDDVDDGEITARSLHVDPSVLGEESTGPDDGEITATSIRVEPSALDGREPELLPEDDLEPEEVEELTTEPSPELDAGTGAADPGVEAPAPVLGSGDVADDAPPFSTGEDPETGIEAGPGAPPPESTPEAEDGLHSLLTDEDLEEALTAEAHALLADGPAEDESGSLEDDNHLDALLTIDARALLADHPKSDAPGALDDDGGLDELLAIDARALLSDGPGRDGTSPAAAAAGPSATEGKVDETLLSGPHPDETHLFLSEDDLLGALADEPQPSVTDKADQGEGALSPEEEALRSLPPEAADPLQAAAALRARYGSSDWSARVRLHLTGELAQAARLGDALATLAAVAEDLVQLGYGRPAMTILKKADRFRHRRPGEAVEDPALRQGVQALLREAEELAARPAPSVEEVAEGAGEEQGHQLAG